MSAMGFNADDEYRPPRGPTRGGRGGAEASRSGGAASGPSAGAPLDPSLWRRILTRVRLAAPTLNRKWFPTLKPYQLSNGVILVHCQKVAELNHLQGKCADTFSEAAQEVTDRLVSVAFHCENMPTGTGGVFNESEESIPLSADHTFDEFVVGPSNRLAHAACVAVSDAPGRSNGYNPLFIHGDVGLGKTHLLQAICAVVLDRDPDAKILYLSCEAFIRQYINAVASKQMNGFRQRYRHVDVLVVDDVHFLAGHEQTQEEFFHTFNTLHQQGKQVVFSADCPPGEIPELTDRLMSRFKWGMVARIDKPGFETRVAIVDTKAREWGLELGDDVVKLVAHRCEANVREIEGALRTLGAVGQLHGRPPTIAEARDAFGADPVAERRTVTMGDILDHVTRFYGVKLQELQGKRRNQSIAWPRQVAMYLARKHCPYSFAEIGGYFGNRDHTTVIHGVGKVEGRLKDQDADDEAKAKAGRGARAEIEQIEAALQL